MSCHLTGNSCHVYGRAYIRTHLDSEPQFPVSRKRIDLDNYIGPTDVTLLMMFSKFYKERILPREVYDFFVNDRREISETPIDTNLDYLKVLQQDIELAKNREDERPKVKFADVVETRDDDDFIGFRGSMTNPKIRMYQDYIAAYMKNINVKKSFDVKEEIKKNAVTLEELRRDLFLRRKRRQKYREFNHEREEDRKAVAKILAAPIPIDRSLLLKENKLLSRKQTKLSMQMKSLGLSTNIENQNTLTEMDTLDKHQDLKIKLMMQKQLKSYDQPCGAMTDFQREIIFSRVLQKNPDVTKHGMWRDCAHCYICEKWQKVDLTFTYKDDLFFEDFCREVVHTRKKKIYKEVTERQKEVKRVEEEQKKQTVVSKSPFRRLNSEIPNLQNMKKRSHSINPLVPIFKDYPKDEEDKEPKAKVTEIKPVLKSFHPIMNPVQLANQKVVDGVKLKSEDNKPVSYAEKRYRLVQNVNFVQFESHDKPDTNASQSKIISNEVTEQEKKLLSNEDGSKLTDSWRESTKSKDLERIKSDPGLMRTAKSMIPRPKHSTTSSQSDSIPGQMVGKFNKPSPKDSEDQSDNGEHNRIKGGIELGLDGYYHGNILSNKIEDLDGTTTKQRLMKVRIMPAK